jgi:hypothetical protein
MCQERRKITFSHNQKTSSVGGLMCGPAVFFLRFLVGRTVVTDGATSYAREIWMSLRRLLFLSVSAFSIISIYMFIQHEQQFFGDFQQQERMHNYLRNGIQAYEPKFMKVLRNEATSENPQITHTSKRKETERRGLLRCDGKLVDSEIIYWKIVPGDNVFESPITPHHGIHHDRYLSFEYDTSGWNNIRMGIECLVVFAHAIGRTLVIPPPQYLYLLGKGHVDPSGKVIRRMGFEDYFDLSLLESQKGFHMLTTSQFLKREGVTGRLNGIYPPMNETDLWGGKLTSYLRSVADKSPEWLSKFVVLPNQPIDIADFNESSFDLLDPQIRERLKLFSEDSSPVFYSRDLQEAHHIHFQAVESYRLVDHHYGGCHTSLFSISSSLCLSLLIQLLHFLLTKICNHSIAVLFVTT